MKWPISNQLMTSEELIFMSPIVHFTIQLSTIGTLTDNLK